MQTKLYGIPNCDTVKKARTWLSSHNIEVDFHDYKKEGITKEKLKQWSKAVSWEILLNKKGTTWRQLPAEIQASIVNEREAIALMIQSPSLIKRPVIELGNKIMVGFDEEAYTKAFL